MINIEDYKNEGWGLSKIGFEKIYEGLMNHECDDLNVVEFGSGTSTKFFLDINEKTNKKINIFSFDNDPNFSFKPDKTYDNLKLNIIDLVDFSDDHFNKMFINKEYFPQFANLKNTPVHTRQRNTFYNVRNLQLPEQIDYLLLDGPHGNGRSIGFLHTYKKLNSKSLIFIDDHTHYPFLDDLKKLIDIEILFENRSSTGKWENGGNFIIVKLK